MYKKYFFSSTFLLFIFSTYSFSQATSKFTLLDSETKEPIAFANIIFDHTASIGTTSNIDGVFYIDKQKVKTLTISYIGYETKTLDVVAQTNNILFLKKSLFALSEIVISPTDNPAIPIIKKVIANKDINNPENINSFSFISYNKVVFDSNNKGNDTINKFLEDKYFFITESVSKRKYLKPKLVEDSIIATRVSGLKTPLFALLSTDFQPFSLYDEYINLIDINYLNPISNGSLKKYHFTLEDKLLRDNDTVFVISFRPKNNKNFEGLKGVLHINSHKYAVQNIETEPAAVQKTSIKIQQQYTLADNMYWFPEQLNFEINFGVKDLGFKYVGKSYITDIKPNIPLKRKDFPFEAVTFKKREVVKDSLFWNSYRTDTLNIREKRTYQFLDSIGKEVNLDKIFEVAGALSSNKLSFKYVNLDLTKIVNYNQYEGLRLGAGIYTNDDVIKNVSFGGYAGYGFKDYTWKYGLEINTALPAKKDIFFSLKFDNTLREVGTAPLQSTNIFNTRNIIAEHMDHTKTISLQSKMKLFRNFYWTFDVSNSKVAPKYEYAFVNGNKSITDYTNTVFTADFKYYFNEKVVTYFGNKMRINSKDPVLSLTYMRGLKNVFNGDFNYNKLIFSIDHTFTLTHFGNTTYRLETGYIDSDLPYGLLFTGEGSYDKKFPVYIKNYFQTLQPYEFVSDNYVNLFTAHNFGGLLFKTGTFQPDILLHNNMSIGTLQHPENHQEIVFKTKNKLFLETGIELKNVLKLNYLDVGYLGFGAGVFYRYGYHSLPDNSDNLIFKMNMSFSFK